MTLDPKAYEFSKAWLAGEGYTWSVDIDVLAERIQECCEDYVADIKNGEVTRGRSD